MKDLLSLEHLSTVDVYDLLAQAQQLKRQRATPQEPVLAGKTVALLFEKPSLRTRISFEVAVRELGGTSLYLSPREVGLGSRESVADVARVLSTYVHAVVLRTFSHATVAEFARHATVPVINGLTDEHHPCQGLTDVLTIVEQLGRPYGKTLAYVGDGANVAHSLLQAAAALGMHIRVASPAGYEPCASIVAAARARASALGGQMQVLRDPAEAVGGADIVYTDVWTSMGQEAERERRRQIFAPYQVNAELMRLAAPYAIFMHPLPARRGEEVTDEVIDGPHSRVFTQAENRLHMQKALLQALLLDTHEAAPEPTSTRHLWSAALLDAAEHEQPELALGVAD